MHSPSPQDASKLPSFGQTSIQFVSSTIEANKISKLLYKDDIKMKSYNEIRKNCERNLSNI